MTHDDSQPETGEPKFVDVMGAFGLLPLRDESGRTGSAPESCENGLLPLDGDS